MTLWQFFSILDFSEFLARLSVFNVILQVNRLIFGNILDSSNQPCYIDLNNVSELCIIHEMTCGSPAQKNKSVHKQALLRTYHFLCEPAISLVHTHKLYQKRYFLHMTQCIMSTDWEWPQIACTSTTITINPSMSWIFILKCFHVMSTNEESQPREEDFVNLFPYKMIRSISHMSTDLVMNQIWMILKRFIKNYRFKMKILVTRWVKYESLVLKFTFNFNSKFFNSGYTCQLIDAVASIIKFMLC